MFVWPRRSLDFHGGNLGAVYLACNRFSCMYLVRPASIPMEKLNDKPCLFSRAI